VCALFLLHYPMHEVVVVNDGSKDGTLDILSREFDLWESISPSAKCQRPPRSWTSTPLPLIAWLS